MRTKNEVKVTCHTCEKDYKMDMAKINIICCDDTNDWTFSFYCNGCGRIEIGVPSEKQLAGLIRGTANIIVWTKPEIPDMYGPPLDKIDLENFQRILDSTPYIVELVEAV